MLPYLPLREPVAVAAGDSHRRRNQMPTRSSMTTLASRPRGCCGSTTPALVPASRERLLDRRTGESATLRQSKSSRPFAERSSSASWKASDPFALVEDQRTSIQMAAGSRQPAAMLPSGGIRSTTAGSYRCGVRRHGDDTRRSQCAARRQRSYRAASRPAVRPSCTVPSTGPTRMLPSQSLPPLIEPATAGAVDWLDLAWRNSPSIPPDVRAVLIRTGFEALFDSDNTYVVRDALSALLDAEAVARKVRTWTTLSGRVQTAELSDLAWWFMQFASCATRLCTATKCQQPSSSMRAGRVSGFGELRLRQAIRALVEQF